MERLYVQCENPDTKEIIAGELEVENRIIDKDRIMEIFEFFQEQGLCGSYAVENCLYKFKETEE
jgi:hypothetical protein